MDDGHLGGLPAGSPLTPLQEAVLDRLRSHGHNALADEAQDAWVRGGRLVGYQVGQAVGDGRLASDFATANAPASESDVPRAPIGQRAASSSVSS